MTYNHKQTGDLTIYTLIAVIILFASILTQSGLESNVIIPMVIVIAILSSFTSLRVTIEKDDLMIKFGYGIYSKHFNLKNVVSVSSVKNHWYYGWGIRVWFWPFMIIYNVSGFDAVEIKMTNGRIYRIGTDEPQILEDAIKQKIKV